MTRWKLAAIGAVLASGVEALSLNRRSPEFGGAYFDRIKEGMTETEVQTMLGMPPGDYRPALYVSPGYFISPDTPAAFPVKEAGRPACELLKLERQDLQAWWAEGRPDRRLKVTWKRWWGKSYGMDVAFDENGRAIGHVLEKIVPPPPPHEFVSKLRWLIGF